MQSRLFALGFGPLPYFRRPGVLLHISPDETDDDDPQTYMLGCVVAHHGNCACKNSRSASSSNHDSGTAADHSSRCYMCCSHPFVEVLFENPRSAYAPPQDGSRGESEVRRAWSTVPVSPRRAVFRALPVGTRLLVRLGDLADVMNQAFDPMLQAPLLERLEAELKDRPRNGQRSTLRQLAHASMVRCFLNVTSVMRCVDGFACVALSCRRIGAENAGPEVMNLYVAPQHLKVPEDDREWECAVSYVLI